MNCRWEQVRCCAHCRNDIEILYMCKCGTVLVCQRNGCWDRDQGSTHEGVTASCAVAERKNSTSVVDIVDIVDSSQYISVVVVVPFSCFLLAFGCRFFFAMLTFLCFRLCLRFCFCILIMQFLCLGGGLLIFPRCRRGGHCVGLCPCPSHRFVRVRAYVDRFPSCRETGICVRRDRPRLSNAKNVFFPLRIREYVL